MDKAVLRNEIRKKLKEIEAFVEDEGTSIQKADYAIGELIGLMTRLYADQHVPERSNCNGWYW